jgi:Tfp pilus assembly protein FimT
MRYTGGHLFEPSGFERSSTVSPSIKENPICSRAAVTSRVAAQAIGSLAISLYADETGSELPEYAIVLAALSIMAIAAFTLFGHVSTNTVTTNQSNFQNSATASYQH